MKTITLTLFLSFLLMIVSSCDEGNEVLVEPDAKLVWTGDFDVDGCGFFIEIDTIQYKPINEGIIPREYRSDDPVSITVQYIDLLYDIEYYCGDTPESRKSKAIKLTSMDLNQELP